VSGCSLLGGGRSAQDEAEDVAAALSSGKLGSVVWSGGSAAQAQSAFDRETQGLGDVRPQVTVALVSDGDDTSTARLSWSWPLVGSTKPWTYRSTARLSKGSGEVDDGWTVRLQPSLVHPDLRTGERLVRSTTLAERADVLGAGGVPLVKERPVVRVGVDRSKVSSARVASTARAVARLVDVDATAYVAKVRAAGPKAFVEAITLRESDASQVLRSRVTRAGGELVADTLPLAPTRDFARAVLGTVGPVTADVVKASGGVYSAGDEAGLSGLESRYDEQLRGTPGARVDAVAADGSSRTLYTAAPVAGQPLRTTLAPRLQRAAEAALSGVQPASALVAIRPSTGDLLAVASGPGSEGYSTATVGQYAPGSTFKVATSLALLRAGLTPTSPVDCPASRDVNGKVFGNYSDYPASGIGRITLATAVANSCNTAFIGQRGKVTQAGLADAAASLGLGVDHDLGFPVFLGSVPATTQDAGGETGHAASMIGQGRVVASPLAMAAVAASVAKGGTVVPRLLTRLPDAASPTASASASASASDSASASASASDSASASPSASGSAEPSADPSPVTATEARQLRSLMRGVVTRGSGSFLAGLPGAPVLAKTGTAEFGDTAPLKTHAWMIAVHGDLAVAVFVDVGESGSGTAGPVLEQFLRAAG